jgi:hypothetical protein
MTDKNFDDRPSIFPVPYVIQRTEDGNYQIVFTVAPPSKGVDRITYFFKGASAMSKALIAFDESQKNG